MRTTATQHGGVRACTWVLALGGYMARHGGTVGGQGDVGGCDSDVDRVSVNVWRRRSRA